MMKNKNNSSMDELDKLLFSIAKKDYEPIPEHIHNNILKTIKDLEYGTTPSKTSDICNTCKNCDTPKAAESLRFKKYKKQKEYGFSFNKQEKQNSYGAPFRERKKQKKYRVSFKEREKQFGYRIPFRERFSTVITKPAYIIAIAFILVLLIASGVVGARQISEKFFKKDHVRLDNIGIANEFIFTEEMEEALKQNVPLNLVQLNDDYYISVHSILLDEINLFTVFELHCKNGVTDDLRFIIRDLKISDENGNIIYASNDELIENPNKGYNNIYNTENSIRELLFMFGNDNSQIKELNFSFSDIEIYRYFKDLNPESTFEDIHIDCGEQNINVAITKDNYNTIKEYVWEKANSESKYNIEKVLLTKTGLYVMIQSQSLQFEPYIKSNSTPYLPTYMLPLKRIGSDKFQVLISYNIKEVINSLQLYNNIDKNVYNLIPKK